MKIYFGHSKKFDYKNELYDPIRKSILNEEHEIVFPHEMSEAPSNSKNFLKTRDLMIAELSYPATGLGIELGWADAFNVPILGVYRTGSKVSSSAKLLTDNFIEYSDPADLVEKIKIFFNGL
ncbi:MAG: hypothetical protein WC831_04715 [Parcubacteria group bacterium]|jgi:hypothetical protein